MANNDTPALAPFGMIDGTGNGPWGRGSGRINCTAASPHQMMHRELEFEYLASRVGFIQVHRETRTHLDIWICTVLESRILYTWAKPWITTLSSAQGILMWIGALCVELFVSSEMVDTETAGKALLERRKVLKASSAATFALLLWMISFFNWHLPYYSNYFTMIMRLIEITWMRYIWHSGPPRIMALIVLLPLGAFFRYAISALVLV